MYGRAGGAGSAEKGVASPTKVFVTKPCSKGLGGGQGLAEEVHAKAAAFVLHDQPVRREGNPQPEAAGTLTCQNVRGRGSAGCQRSFAHS